MEFWVLAGQHSAAFQTARVHGAVPVFVACLHDQAAPEDGYAIALQYYEERALWEPAADLQALLGNPQAAVQLYLKVCMRCAPIVPVGSFSCKLLTFARMVLANHTNHTYHVRVKDGGTNTTVPGDSLSTQGQVMGLCLREFRLYL